MFSKAADLYDKIYLQFKDYAVEARRIRELLQREHPAARSLLDVACGTGEHARLLREGYGYEVDGIDLEEAFVSLAQTKNPGGRFECADMTCFDLHRTYDVVMCLFSSIGYLTTVERVTQSLSRFRAHMKDGGALLVEPWFQPESYTPGRIFTNTFKSDELNVVRMGTSRVEGRISVLRFEYLIGRHGKIEHEVEEHRLGLFTIAEMRRCFLDAGLSVKYDDQGLSGRGLYLARKGWQTRL